MEEIMKFMSDYGVTILIAGIFLYASLNLINLGLDYLKKRVERDAKNKTHEDLLKLRNDMGRQIQLLIDKVLIETNSDRVTVMEFTNSAYNINGLPFMYMTCTYEAYKKELLPVGQTLQNLATSLFNIFLNNLQRMSYITLNTEDRDPNIARTTYEVLAMQGDKIALCCMLQDSQGKAIGYVSAKKNDEFTERETDNVKNLSSQLSVLLDMNKKQ